MRLFEDNMDIMIEALSGLGKELFSYAAEEFYNQENGIKVQLNTIWVDFFFLHGFFTYILIL